MCSLFPLTGTSKTFGVSPLDQYMAIQTTVLAQHASPKADNLYQLMAMLSWLRHKLANQRAPSLPEAKRLHQHELGIRLRPIANPAEQNHPKDWACTAYLASPRGSLALGPPAPPTLDLVSALVHLSQPDLGQAPQKLSQAPQKMGQAPRKLCQAPTS